MDTNNSNDIDLNKRVNDIDLRLKNLENLHAYGFLALIAISVAIIIKKHN